MPEIPKASPLEQSKRQVFELCNEMGAPAVRTVLERGGKETNFYYPQEKVYAWEWLHMNQENRESDQTDALRKTARYTLLVAIFTGIVALLTALPLLIKLFR